MNRIFAYVLELRLTFDKMQNTKSLMCTKFEIRGQGILEVIQAFHTVRIGMYIGCYGPVDKCINKIKNTRYTELCIQYKSLNTF